MDGDGSTLTHDGIFPENLQKLIYSNPQIKWIMATGRSLDLLERTPIIPFLSHDVPHVLDGGSRIMNLSGEVVCEYPISAHELSLFFGQLPIEKIEFLYYYLDNQRRFFYSPDLSKWENKNIYHFPNKDMKLENIIQQQINILIWKCLSSMLIIY